MSTLPITCTECKEQFSGYKSYSEHRAGERVPLFRMAHGRDCMSVPEMHESRNLERDETGVWRLAW